jgi:hypothetical protein
MAIWTASDEKTGEREDRKDGGVSGRCQPSNVNVYIMAA